MSYIQLNLEVQQKDAVLYAESLFKRSNLPLIMRLLIFILKVRIEVYLITNNMIKYRCQFFSYSNTGILKAPFGFGAPKVVADPAFAILNPSRCITKSLTCRIGLLLH